MDLRLLTRRLRLLTHKSGPYVYESPDGGKTVTRRRAGDLNREIISKSIDIDISDVILIEHVKNKRDPQKELFEDENGSVHGEYFTDIDAWVIMPNLHDPHVKRLLGTDVLQQLKKTLGKRK